MPSCLKWWKTVLAHHLDRRFSLQLCFDIPSECKKRSRQTRLTLTLYCSVYTISCFQNSTKSCCVNIRLIKSDSWGLLLLLFQLSKTGHRPGPQAHWLVKCHAVSSQMVRNPSGRQAVGGQGGTPWQRKVWTLLWTHFFYSRRKGFLSWLNAGLRAQDTEGSVRKYDSQSLVHNKLW